MSETETEMDSKVILPSSQNKPVSNAPWHHVDKAMVSSKFSYFFQNAKDSCYLPYMILFLTGIGLTPAQAGNVSGLRFLGFIIGAPLWAILADYKKVHRIIIFILCLVSFFLILSQPFLSIPMTDQKKCTRPDLNKNQSFHSSVRRAKIWNRNPEKSNNLFIILMILNLIACGFDGSTQGFVDSGVMQKINTRPVVVDFGQQRYFGAIGYGMGAFSSSLAVQYIPRYHLPCYTVIFIVYGFFIACLGISTYKLFKGLSFSSGGEQTLTSESSKKNIHVGKLLRKTICNFHTLFFFLTVLVIGTIHGVYIGFLFVLMKKIRSPNIVMGIAIVVGSLASTTCFRLCEKFIKLLGGPMRALCFGSFSWAVRFLLFTYMKNPWLVLPIQLLQGIGFGLFIASSLVHIKLICKPRIYTSMYGIFNGLFFGAGPLLGNVISGSLLMKFEIRTLFFGTSIVGFIWTFIMLVYLAVQFYMEKKNGEKNEEEEIELQQNV